ncbi:helix-turn-helix domain-containing protein [Microbulbifer sp. TRSA001]|uniref:helix-turn-helix domain-containing protein n=1 Tax=Microbulbifer sp. TRSA001 TaxID=3243381 RepID=UPI004039D53E
MKINLYLKSLSLSERDELAQKVGTTGRYLSRIAYGRMKVLPGPKLSIKLAEELDGDVSLAECRPDIWG